MEENGLKTSLGTSSLSQLLLDPLTLHSLVKQVRSSNIDDVDMALALLNEIDLENADLRALKRLARAINNTHAHGFHCSDNIHYVRVAQDFRWLGARILEVRSRKRKINTIKWQSNEKD